MNSRCLLKRVSCLLLYISLFCRGAWAQPSAAQRPDMSHAPELGPFKPYHAPRREPFSLSNGVLVVLIEDHRFPIVTVRLAVRGGSSLVTAADAGLVDAMAELMTEGSSRHNAREIAEEADAIGGAVSVNAAKDSVTVSAFALSDSLDRLLRLAAEIALDPAFPEAEVQLRKKNMLAELELSRGEPNFLASVAFHKKLYGDHPYGVVSPTEASIARIDRARLATMHRRLFAPQNAVVVVAGDTSRKAIASRLEEVFSAWHPTGELPLFPVPAPSPEKNALRRVALLDRPGSVQSVFIMGNPAIVQTHPDYFPLLLANYVLGGTFGSRLTTELRERKGYVYHIGTSLELLRGAGAFVLHSAARTEATIPALDAVLAELARLRRGPISAQELSQAQSILIGRFLRRLETQNGVADSVLHGLLFDLPPDYLDTYADKVKSITMAQALKAVQDYIRPDALWITVVGDAARLDRLSAISSAPIERVDQDGNMLPK